ncbi:thioredoxin-like protein [Phycomyces nitens]|nr:thioredoxin-like protein [Phycomyces nitens]
MLRTSAARFITRRSFHVSSVRAIKEGDSLPSLQVARKSPGDTVDINKLFSEKAKAVLFGVPGAFTPGCSKTHLPGFIKLADELKKKGIDYVACISVNDPFVMTAWGESQGNKDEVELLADPTGALAKAMDLNFDATAALGGHRFQRFAAIVEHGKVKKLFVEPDKTGLNVSLAENVVKTL